ncbi:hypothetical protein [Thiobacillus thioparus]|uniref:hypothetical protein n=1 Tax=Thiobacillus thioparus TaxID=931 RepID=UPI00037211DD|nr:hypothetical protein [Thiobacillus thioparus]
MKRIAALSAYLLTALLLVACSSSAIQRKDGSSSSVRSFSLRDLAKSDVDEVIEIHQQAALASLKTLTLKLYRRNPSEWRKSGYASADEATETLFKPLSHWHLSSHKDLDWQASLRDAWREEYTGDRVKALMDGLLVMHMAAFNHRTEFYLLSDVDAQKLYNAARNTEAVVWKLATTRNSHNAPLLLSNGTDGNDVINLSFEREFGKLIGNQDTLARIVEDKSNRAIRFGVVNLTSMVFLPV